MITLRVIKKGYASEQEQILHPGVLHNSMKFLENEDREKFYVLHLDAKMRILGKELIAVGTLTNSLIHPREVFKGAILNNSAYIILVHNHPSGDATPSENDIKITEKLINLGELLGVEVIDHVIIGCNTLISMKTDCKSMFYWYGIEEKQDKYNGKNRTKSKPLDRNESLSQDVESRANTSKKRVKALPTLQDEVKAAGDKISKMLEEKINCLKTIYLHGTVDEKIKVYGILGVTASVIEERLIEQDR